jgi:hypothetical protein
MNDDARLDPLALTTEEMKDIAAEIDQQPAWRATADKEMAYADGNQLDSKLMQMQKDLGVPPAIDDMIGPALEDLQGYEVATRTDWRVTADGQVGGQDVADALNYRLNQAERHSGADRACSDAFRPQIGCGLGWVEVARESNPFCFPYRCSAVHRNEIRFDMRCRRDATLSNARWLKRELWVRPERLKLQFPQHAELLDTLGRYGPSWWNGSSMVFDGGASTGLQNAWGVARSWTQAEDRWFNPTTKETCVAEMWYRRWVSIPVLKLKDGRAIEMDQHNEVHALAVRTGKAKVVQAVAPRVRRAFWIGPYRLDDGPSPYTHQFFPYIPFWGFIEDDTGIHYGYVRRMIYPQDSLNSGTSKLRWGMAVVRVEFTKGATDMATPDLLKMVARRDSAVELNAEHMARPGARFEVMRDFQLTDQQHQMLRDNRESIARVSPATSARLRAQSGGAKSGLQESIQVDQDNQSVARIMDNRNAARSQIGELLLAMIVEDIGNAETEIIVEGDAITEDRTITLNKPELDDEGFPILSNDLQRVRLKVSLEDVPSTNSYRAQQLGAMSEAIKSLPSQYQAAAMPFLASLMDVPFKRDLVEALRAAGEADDPKVIEKKVREEVANELKARELELKAVKNEAEVKEILARAVQVGVQAAYSAMQAGAQIVQMPTVAPIADIVMQSAGYQEPDPAGVDPNYPQPQQAVTPAAVVAGQLPQLPPPQVQQNTSPAFPPIPSDGNSPMRGIETPETSDNLA